MSLFIREAWADVFENSFWLQKENTVAVNDAYAVFRNERE